LSGALVGDLENSTPERKKGKRDQMSEEEEEEQKKSAADHFANRAPFL
jgi:hypothetical protein